MWLLLVHRSISIWSKRAAEPSSEKRTAWTYKPSLGSGKDGEVPLREDHNLGLWGKKFPKAQGGSACTVPSGTAHVH